MIYNLSRKALRQIEGIIRYTDKNFGEQQTAEYINGLYYSFGLLVDNPQMGMVYDQRRRRYVYCSHHIYYRLQKDTILIVDIRNTRQQPPVAHT